MRRFLGAAALLLALATTPLWSDLATLSRAGRLAYAEKRDRLAFPLPISKIAELVDRRIPADAPIALGRGLEDELRTQRLTEALYPRVVAAGAPYVLEVDADEVRLRGASDTGPDPGPAPRESLAFEPARGAIAASALLGCGLFGVAIARTLAPASRLPWLAAPLLALAALGIAAQAGTWLASAVLTRRALAGALLVAALGFWFARRALAAGSARLWHELDAGATAVALLSSVIGARMLLLPVTGWDGRSIWLFHAKQLFFHGHLPREDLLRESLAFSHPEYPLALPALLAAFALPSSLYNERLAAMGLVFLTVAITALLFACARERLGAPAAAVVTAVYLLGVEGLSSNAYADGFLAGLLAIQALCAGSRNPELRRLQWLAALCASLLKLEGLLFSACLAAASLARDGVTRARSLAKLAVFLPALAHVAFARALGLRSDFRGVRFDELAAAPFERARDVAGALAQALVQPGYDRCDGLVWIGAAAFAFACLAALGRRADRSGSALLLLPIAAIAAVIVLVFFATPMDLEWHVRFAFDRLAIHPALLSVVAAATLVSTREMR